VQPRELIVDHIATEVADHGRPGNPSAPELRRGWQGGRAPVVSLDWAHRM